MTKKQQFEFLLRIYRDRIRELDNLDNLLVDCLTINKDAGDYVVLDMLYRSLDDARIRVDSARRDLMDWILDNEDLVQIVTASSGP